MSRSVLFFAFLLILIPGMAADTYPNASLFDPVQSGDSQSILVKYNTSITEGFQTMNEINTGIHAVTLHDYSELGLPGLYLVRAPDFMSTSDSLIYYQNQPGVEYAEPDSVIRFQKLPNDSDFQNQWGLYNTGQIFKPNQSPGTPGADLKTTEAWNLTTGSREVVIAVLDTGIDYYHPDLSGNLWTDPVTGAHGYNVLDGSYDPLDLWGHGTHCSGIVGAVGNNGIGVTGVCWNVSVMGVKVGQQWEGKISDSISGILWAGQHGADIISCSWGEAAESRALEEAISMTPALFVCAAGNDGIDLDQNPFYPAGYDLPNVLSVAATDPNDNLTEFSNYGAHTVEVGSPGVSIYSTWKGQSGAEPFWIDQLNSLSNWSYQGNWQLDTVHYNSSPSSAAINLSFQDPVLIPYFVLNTPVNLSGHTRPVLQFSYDGIFYWPVAVKLTVDACVDKQFNWKRIGDWSAGFLTFETLSCDIPEEFSGKSILVRFGFQQQYPPEGENKTIPARIDDIRFSEKTDTYTPSYRHVNGTSMACPAVAGVAGLVKSVQPDLSPDKLRERIIATVDKNPSMQGKTLSGGRVNGSAAVRYSNSTSGAIPLQSGWNIVSIPQILVSGNNTAAIFQYVKSGGHGIYLFDPDTGYIRLHQTDIIRPFDGYWVYSQSPMNVPVEFCSDPLPVKSLKKGWNLIGPGSTVPVQAKQALSTLGLNWTMVTGYNASVQQYEEPIMNGGTGNSSDERMLIPYHGYWLLMNGTGTLS